MRSTRYMFSRRVETSDAKALMVVPVFNMEAMSGVRGTIHVRSLPNVGNAFQFIGPNGAIEYNCYGLYVPWEVVSTFVGGANSDNQIVELPHPPSTTAEFDAMFRRLVLENGVDGNEFYGANPDGAGNEYDPVRNMWVRRRGENATDGDTTQDEDQGQDEPLTYGPRGIQRVFSRETILTSDSISTLGKEISGLTKIFSSAGINDLVYSDEFEISEGTLLNGPGYFIVGVVRFAVDETEGFSAAYHHDTTPSNDTASEQARNRALNIMFGGDHDRAQWIIQNSTSLEGDYIRSLLFGGDNYLEDAGAYTPVDFYDDGSWFRPNEIVVSGKLFVGHESPYVLRPI